MENWKENFLDWIKSQSRYKLFVAGVIIIALPVLILSRPQGAEFRKRATEEIEMAKQICIAAHNEVTANPQRLKLDENTLNDIPVNGQIPKLKYVEYPKVIYTHGGFARMNTSQSIYCAIKDPRGRNEYGTNTYYYDYQDRSWRGTPTRHYRKDGFVQ
jgi:hypothetical protein